MSRKQNGDGVQYVSGDIGSADDSFWSLVMAKEKQDDNKVRFPSGAVRSKEGEKERWDLITPIGLRRLAETCAEGAEKYGVGNWQRGIPASNLLNHAIRHIYLYLEGDDSEDHLAHAAWNILAVCHFEETDPGQIDIPTRRNGDALY